MENDWEIFDDVEWVRYWFVWLRIFNNFVNMVIWTFWTLSISYTLWLFFFTREMHFLSYYVFIYMMYVNVFALVFLDDYLYFSAEERRENERSIRIAESEANDELYAATVRTEKLLEKLKLYPNIRKQFLAAKRRNKTYTPIQVMALLAKERKKALRDREQELKATIAAMKKEN